MWKSSRGLAVAASVITAVVVTTGVAWAYWSAQATDVPALSSADAVGTGNQPTVTVNGTTVTLNWVATTTTAGRGVTGYVVTRYPEPTGGIATAAAQGTCATQVTGLTCGESSTPDGSWYYTVTPVLGAWRGTESPRSDAAVVAASHTFALSWQGGGTTRTAGAGATLTITALAGTQTDTNYSGARTLTFSGPGPAPNGTPPSYNGGNPSVLFTSGAATVPVTLYKAETTTLTVTDGTTAGNLTTTVIPATATQLQVPTPPTAIAGSTQSLTLTAQDPYRNTATSYTGNKTLTWSGPGTAPDGTHTPAYPNPATFTGGIAANLPVTFYRAETTTLTVADATVSGTTAPFTVLAATATQLGLPTPATQTAGTAFTVGLTALDSYKNLATSYTGTKTLNWTGSLGNAPSGGAPLYPAGPVTFSGGAATVSMTPVKAETATLKVTDSTISGTSGAFTVNPGTATKLAWTSSTVSTGTLSSPFLFTCTATGNNNTFTTRLAVTDTNGNIANNAGGGHTVTVTATGGTFSAPTAGAGPVVLTISATGPATATQQLVYQSRNGSWTTDTLTATSGGYTNATATINKN